MKRIFSICVLLSMFLPSLARASERTPEAAVQTIGDAVHDFPRIARDQSRTIKKQIVPLLDRQCNCKQRCNREMGVCVPGTSADSCSPGEFWPEVCDDCVSTKCS